MKPGNIILLNGTSSSGKSSIAKALQEIMAGYYIHTGIDHFLVAAPNKIHTRSDGKDRSTFDGFLWVYPNDDNRVAEIRAGPKALSLWTGMYRAAAALAAIGNDVIIDDLLFDPRVLKEAIDTLQAFKVLFVGVRCAFAVAEQRERERGNRNLGLVQAHYDLVHAHGIYDLEVDTTTLSSMACAEQIKDRLLNGPPPNALQRLHLILKER